MTDDEILQAAKEATNNQPIYGRKEFTFSAEELQRFAAIIEKRTIERCDSLAQQGLEQCEWTDNADYENARRITACVNACVGISTENLEDNVPIKELARRYNETLKQRDELLAAMIHIQQVACSGSPELGIATDAIACVKGEQ